MGDCNGHSIIYANNYDGRGDCNGQPFNAKVEEATES